MNILLASNEKYLKYASVLVASIFKNCTSEKNIIYYIYSDVESKYKEALSKQVEESGGEIHFIPFPEEYLRELVVSSYFSKEVYSTLFPHLFLPKEMDRILYLDIDTIVNADVINLYNMDFEDNFLIAASNVPDYQNIRNFEEKRMRKGEYFNSGVVLYNLKKLREEIGLDYYKEVLMNSQNYFFDQGMLNWLFCKKTKYVDPMLYNYRHTVARKAPKLMNKEGARQIIHYLSTAQPYKPWDLVFTREELSNISMIDYKKEKYIFYIDELSNDLNILWWEYAKLSPIYDELYNAMIIKKEYLNRFSIWDKVNKNTAQVIKFKNYYSYEMEKDDAIKKLNKNNIYIDSLKMVGRPRIEKNAELCEIVDVTNYFAELRKRPELVLICSCKDTCANYFEAFADRAKVDDWETAGFRESYIAIYCGGKTLYCEKNTDELRYDFIINKMNDGIMKEINDDYLQVSVISKGFVSESQISVSKVLINNYNYGFNGLGLNGVCINRETLKIVDIWCVNTHKDVELKINRKK